MHPAATRSSQKTIDQFAKYVIPNYKRYPVSLVHGEGSYVWDAEGKKYLDLFPGWGCDILGHSPHWVVKAIQQQIEHLIHIPNTWYTEPKRTKERSNSLVCTIRTKGPQRRNIG